MFNSTSISFRTTTLFKAVGIYPDVFLAKLNGIASIPELSAPQSLTISPNPTSSSFTITSSSKIETIYITDVLGSKILKQVQNDQSVTINISQLPSGIYFIQVTDENKNSINRKIIKE